MPSKKRKIRLGVIGCGHIFNQHRAAIEKNKDLFQLVAVCDSDPQKFKSISDEFRVPGFRDYHKMLKEMSGKMDFVTIASPNIYHFEQATASLKAGYDILVEKPVDILYHRVLEIDLLAKRLHRKAYAVLQVRSNLAVQALKEATEKKVLGKIRSVSLIQRWQRPEEYFRSWQTSVESGGWTLYEVGIHYLDVLQWLFGMPIVKASSSFSNRELENGFKDTVFAILQFPSGASGSVEITTASEPQNLECSISVMGSEGYIKIGGKAIDRVESAFFSKSSLNKNWANLIRRYGLLNNLDAPTGAKGSSPNHPQLYNDIYNGHGITVREAAEAIKLIESIYIHEV